MIIKTSIEFTWDTDDENEDRLEISFEDWAVYYKNLMAEDIENFVKNNGILEAIKVEQIK